MNASKAEGSAAGKGKLKMGEWIAIEQWERCVELAKPGIVFELRNAEGNSMLSPCVSLVPPPPFDWKSPPTQFRAVVEAPPEHSTPIPPPKG